MPSADFFLKQHDTSSSISETLTDAAGAAVNISGGTVKFIMRPIGGTAAKVNATASVIDGSAGSVRYNWQTADVDTAGMFLAEWQVNFAGGSVQTFPNAGYVLVRVTPDLG